MNLSRNSIIFAHIPKTAGSTLRGIAETNYTSMLNLYPKNKSDSTNIKDWIETFNSQLYHKQLDTETTFVCGHFGFGIHDFLKFKNYAYITFLRDPVDRVISHYYFLKQIELESKVAKQNQTLDDFVNANKYTVCDNLQTRFLSGLGWQSTSVAKILYPNKFKLKHGECTPEMLLIAKENLRKYFIFGIQNKFTESLELFKSVLEWKQANLNIKKNVNKKRLQKQEIDLQLIKLIERQNILDIELYNYAQKLFENQFADLKVQSKIIDNKTIWSYPSIPKRDKKRDANDNLQDRSWLMKAQLSENHQLQLNEAEQMVQEKNYTEAISKYKEVIQANPEYIPALNKLAKCYGKMKADEQAIAVYKRIVALDPNKDKVQAKLAKLMTNKGNMEEAIQRFKKAISINADQPDWVYIALGSALKKAKKAQLTS